jgi:hypothetical protein
VWVQEIWRYPVKSMAGEKLDAADLTTSGVAGDRVVQVRNHAGQVMTARTKPLLLRHRATLGGDNQVLVDGRLEPVEIQHILLQGVGSSFQIALDDDDTFLHVVDQRASGNIPLGQGDLLHVLRVNADGTLVEVVSSPTDLSLPNGTRPQGVVAF